MREARPISCRCFFDVDILHILRHSTRMWLWNLTLGLVCLSSCQLQRGRHSCMQPLMALFPREFKATRQRRPFLTGETPVHEFLLYCLSSYIGETLLNSSHYVCPVHFELLAAEEQNDLTYRHHDNQ